MKRECARVDPPDGWAVVDISVLGSAVQLVTLDLCPPCTRGLLEFLGVPRKRTRKARLPSVAMGTTAIGTTVMETTAATLTSTIANSELPIVEPESATQQAPSEQVSEPPDQELQGLAPEDVGISFGLEAPKPRRGRPRKVQTPPEQASDSSTVLVSGKQASEPGGQPTETTEEASEDNWGIGSHRQDFWRAR